MYATRACGRGCSTPASGRVITGFEEMCASRWSPLWKPNTPDAYKETLIANVGRRFDLIEPVLAKQPYLMGETFSIADAYLFTIVNWHKFLKLDIAKWPALTAYQARVAARPRVHEALKAEHLITEAKAA